MTLYVGPIVEGQTEQRCVERLLHRVWAELLSSSERLQVVAPFRGRRPNLVHPNGEEQSGAAWLKKQLRDRDRKRTYKKTVDAELFVRSINLAECRNNSPSFDKLCRTLEAQLRRPPV